jgi:hypothetical protein
VIRRETHDDRLVDLGTAPKQQPQSDSSRMNSCIPSVSPSVRMKPGTPTFWPSSARTSAGSSPPSVIVKATHALPVELRVAHGQRDGQRDPRRARPRRPAATAAASAPRHRRMAFPWRAVRSGLTLPSLARSNTCCTIIPAALARVSGRPEPRCSSRLRR